MFVLGVDGCRGGWVSIALDNGRFAGAKVHERFEQIAQNPAAIAIGVDMPIGLLDRGLRLCDRLLREVVGPRRASVFTTPPRPAVEAASYEEANAICRELAGQGLSKQSYHLHAKILEVDAVVQREDEQRRQADRAPLVEKPKHHLARVMAERGETRQSLRRYARIIEPTGRTGRRSDPTPLPAGRIVEVHPEASFRELAGAPLEHAKKTPEGIARRRALLEEAQIDLPEGLADLRGVALDDVLDAAAVAWTASRYAGGRARCVPPPELWQVVAGRPIAIWV